MTATAITATARNPRTTLTPTSEARPSPAPPVPPNQANQSEQHDDGGNEANHHGDSVHSPILVPPELGATGTSGGDRAVVVSSRRWLGATVVHDAPAPQARPRLLGNIRSHTLTPREVGLLINPYKVRE
jgi:hypothetical protein